jgi:hypothetical protein
LELLGLGVRVRVKDSKSSIDKERTEQNRVQGSRFKVQGSRLRVKRVKLRVWG